MRVFRFDGSYFNLQSFVIFSLELFRSALNISRSMYEIYEIIIDRCCVINMRKKSLFPCRYIIQTGGASLNLIFPVEKEKMYDIKERRENKEEN